MGTQRHKVLVVDDDPAVRKSLERLLDAAGYQVQTFASAEALLRQKPCAETACLVLDLQLPGLNGLELQRRLAGLGWLLPIIFVTGRGDIPTSVRAIKAGAVNFLPKPVEESELLADIETALAFCRQERRRRDEQALLDQRYASLTPRERQVLARVVAGKLNKQIADDLRIAEKTVKVHRGRAMKKMRAQSVPELVRMSQKLSQLPPAQSPA